MNVKEVLRNVSGVIACLSLVVVLAACFGGGGNSGGSGGGSGEASAQVANGGEPYVIPVSDFVYELSADSKGVRIRSYTGPGGNIILPTDIEGLPIVEFDSFFVQFNNVTSIVIPDYYLEMWENLLQNNYGDVSRIGPDDFLFMINYPAGDTPLEKITFPKGITYIPLGLCANSPLLKSVIIPDTVKEIGNGAFSETGLTSIVIPEGVTIIGDRAFAACKDLKSVTLPESIVNIGYATFGGCTNLEIVNLPSHQIEFESNYGSGAFEGCPKFSLAAQQVLRNAGYTGSF